MEHNIYNIKKASYRLVIVILGFLVFSVTETSAQMLNSVKIDLEVKSKSLKEVFQLIEQKSTFRFVYNDEFVAAYSDVTISRAGKTVASLLAELLDKTNLSYVEQNNRIIIEKKAVQAIPSDNKTLVNKDIGSFTRQTETLP